MTSYVSQCDAKDCVFNQDGKCGFLGITIDAEGSCDDHEVKEED